MTVETISDDVILLRPFTLEDAEVHLRGEDDELIKWLSDGKSTLAGVNHWIEQNTLSMKNGGPVFTFGIVADGTLVGMVEMRNDLLSSEGFTSGDVNISYGIYPRYRRRGYASRAVRLMVNFVANRGFHKAIIKVSPHNDRSLRVAERCGFTKERQLVTENGEPMIIYVKQVSR